MLKTLVKPQGEFEELLRQVTLEKSDVDRYAKLVDAHGSFVFRHKGELSLIQPD